VAQAECEAAVPGSVDDLPGGGIDLTAMRTRYDSPETRFLRLQHEPVDLAGEIARLSGGDRACAVRVVPAGCRSPLDHHQLSFLDLHITRFGVRQRSVRTGRHDRVEADSFGASLAHLELERGRHGSFGSPEEPARDHRSERLVGDRGRGPELPELPLVLHPTQLLHQAMERNQLNPLRAARGRSLSQG
jgi:hypothetical protein